MNERYDIRLNKAYMNANNDIEWIISDIQHIEDTIEAMPGEWKQDPTSGVGVGMFLNSSGIETTIARKVMIELQKDLYRCNNPTVSYTSDGKVNINPNL